MLIRLKIKDILMQLKSKHMVVRKASIKPTKPTMPVKLKKRSVLSTWAISQIWTTIWIKEVSLKQLSSNTKTTMLPSSLWIINSLLLNRLNFRAKPWLSRSLYCLNFHNLRSCRRTSMFQLLHIKASQCQLMLSLVETSSKISLAPSQGMGITLLPLKLRLNCQISSLLPIIKATLTIICNIRHINKRTPSLTRCSRLDNRPTTQRWRLHSNPKAHKWLPNPTKSILCSRISKIHSVRFKTRRKRTTQYNNTKINKIKAISNNQIICTRLNLQFNQYHRLRSKINSWTTSQCLLKTRSKWTQT